MGTFLKGLTGVLAGAFCVTAFLVASVNYTDLKKVSNSIREMDNRMDALDHELGYLEEDMRELKEAVS